MKKDAKNTLKKGKATHCGRVIESLCKNWSSRGREARIAKRSSISKGNPETNKQPTKQPPAPSKKERDRRTRGGGRKESQKETAEGRPKLLIGGGAGELERS